MLMADAGCRVGEALCFQPASLSPDGHLRVWGYKSGRWRLAPVTDRLRTALSAVSWPPPPKPKGKAHKALVRAIQRLLRPFGVTPHQLRHSFATRCALAGIPLTVIQRSLGHANPATTLIYIHAGAGSLADAAARLAALAAEETPDDP